VPKNSGWPDPGARADLGSALRRSGARTQAREPLRQALDLAHANGGLALAERARSELIIAGGRPRRQAIRGRDALTPSELRVAQMAAEGQTNRQIAQALFVTQRTVEAHLTSEFVADAVAVPDQAAYRLPAVGDHLEAQDDPADVIHAPDLRRAVPLPASRRTPQPFDRSR
jgi:hypothetical protein